MSSLDENPTHPDCSPLAGLKSGAPRPLVVAAVRPATKLTTTFPSCCARCAVDIYFPRVTWPRGRVGRREGSGTASTCLTRQDLGTDPRVGQIRQGEKGRLERQCALAMPRSGVESAVVDARDPANVGCLGAVVSTSGRVSCVCGRTSSKSTSGLYCLSNQMGRF